MKFQNFREKFLQVAYMNLMFFSYTNYTPTDTPTLLTTLVYKILKFLTVKYTITLYTPIYTNLIYI